MNRQWSGPDDLAPENHESLLPMPECDVGPFVP